MSYARDPKKMEERQAEALEQLRITSFEVVGHRGRVVAHAYDADEARDLAYSYRANPELSFVGMNASGQEVEVWTIGDVLSGAFAPDAEGAA